MFLVSIAYASNHIATAQGFLAKINQAILFPLITLMTAVALLLFLWGGFEYVKNSASEQGREQGRKHLIWGVVGMLIMLSAYAILTIAAATFGLEGELERMTTPQNQNISNIDRAPSGGDVTTNTGGDLTNNTGGDITTNTGSGKCYSAYDCGPSQNTDLYSAFREEVQYTGGLANGTADLMIIDSYLNDEVNGGQAQYLDVVNRYYANDWISGDTYNRLISAADAETESLIDRIGNLLEGGP